MNIIHLSNTDSGGAIELHKAMLEGGWQSAMLVKGFDVGGAKDIERIGWFQRYKSNIGNYLARLILSSANQENGLASYSYPFIGASLSKHPAVVNADIIYLHFVAHSSFLSLNSIEALLKLNKPVIFITRDMWPVTGGCHYFLDCEGFKTSCSNCPYYEKKKLFNWPNIQLRKKQLLYSKYSNLYFVAISKWNEQVIRDSAASKWSKVITIQNPIDTSVFKPLDKINSRGELGLPTNRLLIGFGAKSVNNPIKGLDYLVKAIHLLKEKNVEFDIVTFGGGQLPEVDRKVFNLGSINNTQKLALVYNSLDLFISPAINEAFGNTVAESMACGTPVVGFRIGGLIDIIDHKLNGYLAEPKNFQDLAEGINYFLYKPISEKTRLACQWKIESNFSRNVIFNKHKAFINNIVAT